MDTDFGRRFFDILVYIGDNIDKKILITCASILMSKNILPLTNDEPKTVLVFYSKSADKKAGYGAGEILQKNDDFSELNRIKNWRRILSNFHYEPFIWNNTEWYSIEEAFQASKFGKENYELFKQHVRNNCPNKEDNGLCSQQARKWKKLNETQLAEWDKKKDQIMKSISEAKYTQSSIGKLVLQSTKDSTLMHFLPRKTYKIHFKHLEDIRKTM
jgi:predicted NAD-dependent protein-ADP-ribosyltransferase YbiA (DUF1768 family)